MNDDKLLESIKRIREKFKTEMVTEEDRHEMSFLDEVDSHLKDILGDNHSDVYTVFNKEKLEKWKKRKLWRKLKRVWSAEIFYVLLLSVITVFLVSEALGFYAIGGSITFSTYIKAILTEVCFIFLSGYRAVGKVQTLLVGAMRIALFSLMLFVISSTVMFTGVNTFADIKNISSQVAIVDHQIKEKEKEINYYISIKWPKNATTARLAKEKLVDKLIELKTKQIDEKKNEDVADLVIYQAWGRAAFRTLLLLISVLLTRRLFRF